MERVWRSKEEIDNYSSKDRTTKLMRVYTDECKQTDNGEMYYMTEQLSFVEEMDVYNAYCKENNLSLFAHDSINSFVKQGRVIWFVPTGDKK
jgi:hypothetical protein